MFDQAHDYIWDITLYRVNRGSLMNKDIHNAKKKI